MNFIKTYLSKDHMGKWIPKVKNSYVIDEESLKNSIKTLMSSPFFLSSYYSSMGFGKDSILDRDERKIVWSDLEPVIVV